VVGGSGGSEEEVVVLSDELEDMDLDAFDKSVYFSDRCQVEREIN
jgi:hypothetical protein